MMKKTESVRFEFEQKWDATLLADILGSLESRGFKLEDKTATRTHPRFYDTSDNQYVGVLNLPEGIDTSKGSRLEDELNRYSPSV